MSDPKRFESEREARAATTRHLGPTAERYQSALERYLAAVGYAAEHEPTPPGATHGALYWQLSNITVADVMNPAVVAVPENAPFKQIVDTLARHRIDAVPVIDPQRKVLGVVSTSDLLAKVVTSTDPHARIKARQAAPKATRRKARAESARELMTTPPITATPDVSIVEAARIAAAARVRRLPVIDASGSLVGIVSRFDLLRVFQRTDAEIHRHLVDTLAPQIERDQLAVEMDVTDGIVTLRGEVDRKSRAAGLLGVVRSVAGVIGVHDELTYRFDDTFFPPPPSPYARS
jgi:CBS domain-containing protein